MKTTFAKLAIVSAITLALAGAALAASQGSGSRAPSRIALPDTSLPAAMSVTMSTSVPTSTFYLELVVIVAHVSRTTPEAPVATTCGAWRKGRLFGGLVRTCETRETK